MHYRTSSFQVPIPISFAQVLSLFNWAFNSYFFSNISMADSLLARFLGLLQPSVKQLFDKHNMFLIYGVGY